MKKRPNLVFNLSLSRRLAVRKENKDFFSFQANFSSYKRQRLIFEKIEQKRFKKKLEEVFLVSPNNLGWQKLTNLYKYLTAHLKIYPFSFVLPFSFLIIFIFYLIFGYLIVELTNLLQYGF